MGALDEWWPAAFTPEQRRYIAAKHDARGVPKNANDLVTWASWFMGPRRAGRRCGRL